MANSIKSTAKAFDNTRERRKFTQVDVWQSTFGVVSVKAVSDVYSTHFGLTDKEMKGLRLKFSDMLTKLRRLEDPSYMPAVDTNL